MVGSTKAPNKDEKRRMTVLKENVPCIPCLMVGKIRLPSIQHTVSGMTRDGHDSTYSSCEWHHFGHPLENWQSLPGHIGGANQASSGLLGPSFAMGRRPFESFFGPEALLVAIASRLVASFERSPWMDYNVPHDVRSRARSYWERKVR
jgi:hypothetical protein